jgi:hypothetical protein
MVVYYVPVDGDLLDEEMGMKTRPAIALAGVAANVVKNHRTGAPNGALDHAIE